FHLLPFTPHPIAISRTSPHMTRHTRAILVVIALMGVWGSTFLITKTTVNEIPPFTLGAIRFLLGSIVLIPIVVARGSLKRLHRPFPVASVALLGLIGIAGFSAAFNNAMLLGSVTQGSLIFAMVPAAVAVASVLFLHERLSSRRITGIALSIIGVVIVVSFGRPGATAPNPVAGALCMLGAVITWATYTVIAKRLADVDPIVVTAGASLVGALVLLPMAIWELSTRPFPNPTFAGWMGALFLGVVASGLAYAVYSWALKELDASLVGTLVNLDPIVGVLSAVLILGESLAGWQILGGFAALAGMWLASYDRQAGTTATN
ncbi:MAG: DMT family transporter, partial [Gemmatimonadota bacterium]